jgi:PPP family 3-phenylpropionic acid transporter
MRKIWPFSINFLLYAGFATVAPFLVLYYQALGFTGIQIGVLTGITPLLTLISVPLWTRLADAKQRHRLIMSTAILTGAFTLFMFPLLDAFIPIMLLAFLFNIFYSPVASFIDSATMYMLTNEKEMYGRIRLGGTIGFGLAAPFAGLLVENFGLKWAFWGSSFLFFLALLVSQKLVFGQPEEGDQSQGSVRNLLANPRWRCFLALAFIGGLGFVATNTYFFPYMKELGASESTMGLALAIGTISEIPILFFGNYLIRRFKAYGLLLLTMFITSARLLLFAATGVPWLVLALQLINGFTFPAMWVAAVSYADENAPADLKSTAQGLFNAMIFGIGTAVGGFLGGILLEYLGGRGLFLVFGLVAIATVAIVALIYNRLPKEHQISKLSA